MSIQIGPGPHTSLELFASDGFHVVREWGGSGRPNHGVS